MEQAKIPGGWAIFKTAFSFYKSHLKIVGGLWLVPTVLGVAGTLVTIVPNPLLGLVSILLSFTSGILYTMAFAATILYVHHASSEDTLRSLYKKGTHLFFPMLWVYLLQYLVTLGLITVAGVLGGAVGVALWAVTLPQSAAFVSGFVVFSIATLALTIAASIYLIFSLYVKILDGGDNFPAMARSWTYAQGKVWTIAGRGIVFGFFAILPFILGMILFFITMPSALDPQYIDDPTSFNNSLPIVIFQLYLGVATGLFMNPLLTLSGYFLYKPIADAHVKAPDEDIQLERKRKKLFILSIVGPAALILFLVGLLLFSVAFPTLP